MKARANTILAYLLIVMLVLMARALLDRWLVQAVAPSQATLLRWPVLLSILLIGLIGILLDPYVELTNEPARTNHRDLLSLPLGLGALGALGLILLDLIFRFPENLNVPFPGSLPFYFIGAAVTEIMLHQLPLLLIVGGVGKLLLRSLWQQSVIWSGILVVACLEPIVQIAGGFYTGYGPDFLIPLFMLTYAINLVQLLTYRRAGFVAMLALRWGLYLVWHILWGPVRLRLFY